MRLSDTFNLSTRMFQARKARTLLTILGMGVGIGAILFLVSLGYGLQRALMDRITTADSLVSLDVTETKDSPIHLDARAIETMKTINGVESVSPAFRVTAQASINGVSPDLTILGVSPQFLQSGGIHLDKGVMLSDSQPTGVLISSVLAQAVASPGQDILGQELHLTFFLSRSDAPLGTGDASPIDTIESTETYTVAGVFPSDETLAYVDTLSLGMIPIDRYIQAKVKCQSSAVMVAVRDQILAQGFAVSSLSDTVDQADKIFQVVRIVLMGFGIVSLIVSAIGMFNTMTISLMERTEEIGIMKSVGASDATISGLFIFESMIMGFLGGVGGVFMGLLASSIVNLLLAFLASRLGGKPVDLFYSPPWFIAFVIAFAAFVGLLTALIPAYRASKIDPLDALRYK